MRSEEAQYAVDCTTATLMTSALQLKRMHAVLTVKQEDMQACHIYVPDQSQCGVSYHVSAQGCMESKIILSMGLNEYVPLI
jgi:hypothetical protein